MIPHLFLLITIIILFLLLNRNKKAFLKCVFAILILFLGLRSVDVGLYDTKTVYFNCYKDLLNLNIFEVMCEYSNKENLFYTLFKLFIYLGENYHIVIFLFSIIFLISIYYLIKNNSKDYFFSIILFITCYYLYGTFLIKQCIAIAILVYSYKLLKKNEIKKFFLSVIIASLFHQTALIFLLAYPFSLIKKISYKNIIYIFIIFFVTKIFNSLILEILSKVDVFGKVQLAIKYNIYKISDGSNSILKGLLLNLSTIVVATYVLKKQKKKNKEYEENILVLNLSILGTICFCFSNILVEFYRVALYFEIFNIILLPNIFNYIENKKERIVIKGCILILYILYYLLRNIYTLNAVPYTFII